MQKGQRIQNFSDTVAHRQARDIVMDLGGCPLSGMEGDSQEKLLAFMGYEMQDHSQCLFGKVRRIDERLLKQLDIDTRSVGEILRPTQSQFRFVSKDVYVDEWGITRKFTGKYWDIVQSPLKGATLEDLDEYAFPNGDSIDENQIAQIAAEAKRLHEQGEYVICAEHPVYGVFELGCWLCGFEDFLMRIAGEPEFVHKLFGIILEYQQKVIRAYYGALGDRIHYTSSGDDFATQSSLFMSPKSFAYMVIPYLKQRIADTKRYTQAKFLHHSCGNVYPIVPALAEAGVEILNPIQPVSPEMAPNSLKSAYGDRMVFHGGIDTQAVLPFGSKESITEYVHSAIEQFNGDGGYIFAAAHNIQDDVPPENIVYMFEAARKYGKRT